MMEVKLWTVVCALLLSNRGSAEDDYGSTAATISNPSSYYLPKVTPEASSASPIIPSSLAPDVAAAAALNQSDVSLSHVAAAGNGSANGTPSTSAVPRNDQTNQLATVFPDQSPAPHLHANTTTLSAGDASPGGAALATTSAGSVMQSDRVTLPLTSPSTSMAQNTTSAPKTNTTATNTTTIAATATNTTTTAATATNTTTAATATNTTTAATASTGGPQGSASSASTAVTSPKHIHQPEEHPQTTSATQRETATGAATPSSTSTQTKPRANSPSQLNVGGDTTILHQTQTLDPLLASLVSAFIITAVIVTLLLFLKLRQRNSRPEFHRLQDLPMDDMEDTPLSMYSY